ncbi:MAG: haloacid dehalogenase type II [Candidatus Puniceispirillaceae bacterium]
MAIKAALFDAYGTLLDVGSATNRLVASGRFPQLTDKADRLSDIWRLKQLHYSWLRATMGAYVPFWQCTQDALDFALEQTGLASDDEMRTSLLQLYRDIAAYEDATRLLAQLDEVPCAILSNGNHDMLQQAVTSSGLSSYLDKILSVEDVGIFKPSPAVYQMGCDAYGISPDEVLFFSSNGWDIAGARYFGYQTIWVNRTNQVTERLGDPPHYEVSDLDAALRIAKSLI